MTSEVYQQFIKSDRDTRRMLHKLTVMARTELSELIKPLPLEVQEKLIASFAGEILKGTDQCDGCYGESSRQPCQKCRDNSGRMTKDFAVTHLIRRVGELEAYSKALADKALFG
jgi:hypothetical protein